MTTSSSWEATRSWLHSSSRVCGSLFNPTWRYEKFLKRRQSHRSLECSLPRSRVPVSLRKRQRRYEQSRASRPTCLKSCSEEKRRKLPAENTRSYLCVSVSLWLSKNCKPQRQETEVRRDERNERHNRTAI